VGALLLDLNRLAQRRRIRPADQIPRTVAAQEESDNDAAMRVRAHRPNPMARRALPRMRDPAVDFVEVVGACGGGWERVRPEVRRHLGWTPDVVRFGARPAALHGRVGRASARRRSHQAEHEGDRRPEHVSIDANWWAKLDLRDATADHTLRQGGLASRACIGSSPRFRELIAVEEPEDTPDYEQDELVKRPRNRQKPQRAAPPKRPRNAPLATHNLDSAGRPEDEGSGGSHSASLGMHGPLP
jgi:hypothetical protein